MTHVALVPRLTGSAKGFRQAPGRHGRTRPWPNKPFEARRWPSPYWGPVTAAAHDRPSLASFWSDLPREGMLLLSTVAVETLGTGLVLPFGFIYLHEVRGFTTQTAGSLLAVPAIVGMAVVGPAGP
jgi:hypothetical protein